MRDHRRAERPAGGLCEELLRWRGARMKRPWVRNFSQQASASTHEPRTGWTCYAPKEGLIRRSYASVMSTLKEIEIAAASLSADEKDE